jgi:hypothetical protein
MLYPSVRFSGKSNLRDFEMEAHFLPRSSKKSRLDDRGCIFSGPSIVEVGAFRLIFGLMVPPATWSSNSAARI